MAWKIIVVLMPMKMMTDYMISLIRESKNKTKQNKETEPNSQDIGESQRPGWEGRPGEMAEGGQGVQTSNYEMNK